MTRRERIAFLLDHYADVLAGVRDRGNGDSTHLHSCAGCGRLLPLLGADVRPLYRAVVGMYVYPRFVRRAVCVKCGTVRPSALVGELHRHPPRGKSAAFVARMVRVPLYPVEQREVDGAITWLDENWRGGVFVPDELLPLVSAA